MAPSSPHRLIWVAVVACACAKRPAVELPPPGPWVVSDPPGIEIVLDGRRLGSKTPAQIETWETILPHELSLEAPGRVPFHLAIAAGDPPARVDAQLPIAAYVDAASDPPGASVLVGKDILASTPAKVAIAAGQPQAVTLSLDGYLPETQLLNAVAGETLRLSLTLRRGEMVDLQSDPSGAWVTLDGSAVGRAPLQLPVEVERKHIARMSMSGLLPCERAFRVARGSPETVSCTLDDALARKLRGRFRATEMSLKFAQRQLAAIERSRPESIAGAAAMDRKRARLEELVQRLSDEEDKEQGDIEAHRTDLEERFERRGDGGS